MTLGEIDRALAAWNSRLQAMANNLLDLQGDPTYQLLTGSGGCRKVQLTGVTAARVQAALDAVPVLFAHFSLLQAAIDRAGKLRAKLPSFFVSDAKVHEIEHLLCGPSIEVQAADTPLAQRMLLSPGQAEAHVSPDALLRPMTEAFAATRDAVTLVARAWERLGARAGSLQTKITWMRERSAAEGSLHVPALDTALRRLAEIEARVQADPLGVSSELEREIDPVLAEATAFFEEAERLEQALAQARSRMKELTTVHEEALRAAEQARTRVEAGVAPEPVVEDAKLHGLRDWLDRLEGRKRQGALEPVRIGLRNWTAAADSCLAQDTRARAAHRSAVDACRELRGRLDALKAKARAYGVAETGAFAECARTAESVLYTRPMNLVGGRDAVACYETLLRDVRKEA